MDPAGRRPPGGQPPYYNPPIGAATGAPNQGEEERERETFARGIRAAAEWGSMLRGIIGGGQQRPPPSMERLFEAINAFAHSDRSAILEIVHACPAGSRGGLAWRILALIRGITFKDGDKDPCLQALENARKLPAEGKEPLLKALATLLFKHSQFTFDLTPYVPTLKKELLEKPFSPTVLCFICCGVRYENPSSKAEEEILDLLLQVFFKDQNNSRYIRHLESGNGIFMVKILQSAERLMKTGSSPYSLKYATTMVYYHGVTNIWNKVKLWLFSPYLATQADPLIKVFIEANDRLLLLECLQNCSNPVFFENVVRLESVISGVDNESPAVRDNLNRILERFFKIGTALFDSPNWQQIFMRVIVPMVIKMREGYMSAEELKIFKIWASRYPRLNDLCDEISSFPDFPAIILSLPWRLFIEAESLLSNIILYPEARLPPSIPPPTQAQLAGLGVAAQAICARDFKELPRVPLDPDRIIDSLLSSTSSDQFQEALCLLYLNRREPHFIAAIRKKLESLIPHLLSDRRLVGMNNYGVNLLLIHLEILYEAMQGMQKPPSLYLNMCAYVLFRLSHYIEKCRAKIRPTHQYYLILGKFAEKIPELFGAMGKLSISPTLALPALRTPEEKETFLAALYLLQRVNPCPKLFEESDLRPFFEQQLTDKDRFFAGRLGVTTPRPNVALQIFARQQTGRMASSPHLSQRKIGWNGKTRDPAGNRGTPPTLAP